MMAIKQLVVSTYRTPVALLPSFKTRLTYDSVLNFELRTESYVRRVLNDGNKATGVLYVDTRTGQTYEQPADVVVLAAFTFTNNRLLMLSEIGEPYDPETKKGVIGRNFNGQFNITFLGVRGFFDNKKFRSEERR